VHLSVCLNEAVVTQVADVVEKCLRRNPENRPSARKIFEILIGLLPKSARARPVLSTTRSGSLPPVAEVEHGGGSSGSFQSKISILSLDNYDCVDVATWSGSEPRSSSGLEPQTTSTEGSRRRLSSVAMTPLTSSGTPGGAGGSGGGPFRGEGSGSGSLRSKGVTYEGPSGEEVPGSSPVEEMAGLLGDESNSSAAEGDDDSRRDLSGQETIISETRQGKAGAPTG
jgi:serine/threonine protein kinase